MSELTKVCEHGGLERKCDVCNYRKELADATTTIARLEAEVARLQLAVEGEKAVRHMAVCRLGGLVEGRPTHEGNFLQRIDALVRLEAENAGLRKRAEDSRLVVLYNGPASGCATVSGDWARRTFGPDRCAQITIEAIGNRLTVKPHTANGGGGGQ